METPKRGTWDQLKLSPSQLMKMVIDGKAKIVGKDGRGAHIYEILPPVFRLDPKVA